MKVLMISKILLEVPDEGVNEKVNFKKAVEDGEIKFNFAELAFVDENGNSVTDHFDDAIIARKIMTEFSDRGGV